MIETFRGKAVLHDAVSSSRKLIPIDNVVWRSPDKSLAAIYPLPHHRQYGDDVGNLPTIIDFNEAVMNPNAVPFKLRWQNTAWSGQAEKTDKTPASLQV